VGSSAVACAQVFAQQAKGAGVTVNVNKVDPSIFYGNQYLAWTFAQDFWYTRNYLAQANQGTMPTAPYNETHWKDAQWLALVQEAFRTGDKAKRDQLVGEAQTIEYNTGGLIVWAFNDQIDAYSSKLGGVVPDKSGVPMSSFHFNKFYFV
jgi:peptide/nickel transport system substrate-binding protein